MFHDFCRLLSFFKIIFFFQKIISGTLSSEFRALCIQISPDTLCNDYCRLWTDHIYHLCTIISSKLSILRQLYKYIPNDAQKCSTKGYILPLIDYGSSTWGTTSRSNIETLSKLQKRAARIFLNASYHTASSDFFKR